MKEAEGTDGHSHGLRILPTDYTPGEINSGSSKLEIRWGIAPSSFGTMFLAEGPSGITHLSFFDDNESESLDVLRNDWPSATLIRDDKRAEHLKGQIFSKKIGSKPIDFQLHLAGTPFQQQVWRALLEIPSGELTSYGGLAARIGMPGASRAVGNAIGANRISYLIPCHRVIRANGELGGYRWGKERKRAMLLWEQRKG